MEKEASQKKTQWGKKKDYQNTYQFVKNPIFSESNKEWKEFHFYSKAILHDFLFKKTKEQTTITANT